ncbi:MAG: L-seryl-tRNA(Sec) selenium transferase [Pyrinomonadaceae bacterium]
MKNANANAATEVLRLLPSIDTLLQTASAISIGSESGARQLTHLARETIERMRGELRSDNSVHDRESLLRIAESNLRSAWEIRKNHRLHRLINATGVIVHTNLGRAPLSEQAKKALINDSSGYCNLEYDIHTGKRARRGSRAEDLLAQLTGAEAALIVNNCAAAAVLVLTALCKGGEAVISRGELVEIGGDFRVPDVMDQSGADLIEVGTTNRTKLADYENALTENSRLILKVHPSNYRIVGFTETPEVSELSKLAKKHNIFLYEDAGSGVLTDLSEFGLSDEPLIKSSIEAGADVVTFSGDKLLGGPQAGLIAGRKEVIDRLRRHPLYRALRVSKLIYAALEATFDSFVREKALEEVPVLRMLSMSQNELLERTQMFAGKLKNTLGDGLVLELDVIEGDSVIGGGSAPAVKPKTSLLRVSKKGASAAELEKQLRLSNPGVISRILNDRVTIDLRTVSADEESELIEVFSKLGMAD